MPSLEMPALLTRMSRVPACRAASAMLASSGHVEDEQPGIAAWDQPRLFSAEVRAGFRPLRK